VAHVLELCLIVGVEPRLIKLRSTIRLIFDYCWGLSGHFKGMAFDLVRVMKEPIQSAFDLILPSDWREPIRGPLGKVLRLGYVLVADYKLRDLATIVFVLDDLFLHRICDRVTVKDLEHLTRLLNIILAIVVIYVLLEY
jgi:hypothetical protein